MNPSRPYRMTARAAAVEATEQRILHATIGLMRTTRFADIGLQAVASGAGVSVQTVLRRFGSRERLLQAAADTAAERVADQRRTPPGNVTAAVRTVIAHYEELGDTSLLLLAQEDDPGPAGALVARAKVMHREWVREAFAPFLAAGASEDLLVVATDIYTWKLLRRDARRGRGRTQALMEQLVRAIIEEGSQS